MKNHEHLVMGPDHMDKLYHDPNWLIRFGHQKRLKEIIKLLPDGKNLKILDAGCGEGHLLSLIKNKLPGAQLFGVDVTAIALLSAQKRIPEGNFINNDICRLSFQDNFFEVVICSEVLEHIYQYQQALSELKRVLKPNGLLIITFPHEWLFTVLRFIFGRRPAKTPDHVNHLTPGEIINSLKLPLIKRAGLPLAWPFFISPQYLLLFTK